MVESPLQIGVLALQGDFKEHISPFRRLGVDARPVRRADQLRHLDGLVIPGGESTAMLHLMRDTDMRAAISDLAERGAAIWGTCAGMILMATRLDGEAEAPLRIMDITVARNWFGRQINSFETNLRLTGVEGGPTIRAVFIRAPLVTRAGSAVTTLAELPNAGAVAVREGRKLATAFHPELTPDTRFHQIFLELARQYRREALN